MYAVSLRRFNRYFSAVLLAATFVSTIGAQTTGGAITGTVTDQTGALLPNAKVTIENQATGEARQTVTSSTGLYNVPNLTPGMYSVTVTATGFQTLLRQELMVAVGSELLIDLQMKVGSLSDQIVVHMESPIVEAATSSTGAVVDDHTVRDLPLNGRDWTTLAALQPGVAVIRTQQASALTVVRANRGLGTEMTVDGARSQQNNYRFDGISLNDYAGSGPANVLGASLGVDAIREFSVVTSNPSADYGKSSGGVINAVSRNGANQFHGSGYEFVRNSWFDARNFFDPNTIPPLRRNQFGGSVGGPIKQDNTFFFFDYEGLRQGLGLTDVDTVPSANARLGHLASGNVTVDPKVAPYLNLFPLPNGAVNGDIGTYTVGVQDITNENFFTGRMDHQFSKSDKIHGSFIIDNSKTQGPDAFDDTLLGAVADRRTGNIEESHLFGTSVVNFARIGFNRAIAQQVETLGLINPAVADTALGFLPGKPVGQLNIGGVTLFQGGFGALGEYHFHYNSYQAYDDLSITKGAHALKVGASAEQIQSNEVGGGSPNGQVVFGSVAAFVQNQPTSFTANIPGTGSPLGLRQKVLAGYAQDDWRLRPNLTLNLGVRYEMSTVPTEQFNRLATLTSLTATQVKIGAPYFNNPTLRDFSPRVGLAWDPFGNGKTAVRAAFGIYDSLPLTYEFALLSVLAAPFNEQGSATNVPRGSFPNNLYTLISPSSLRTGYIEQNPKRNYVEQWNLSIQHQVAPNMVVEATYAGSHGVHSPFVSTDVNTVLPTATPEGYVWPTPRGSGTKLNPSVGAIQPVIWQVSSDYDALRVRLTRRLNHGVQLQGSYTFSKSLDTGSGSFQTAYTNSLASMPLFDPRLRRALSDFDIRDNLLFNALWQLPAPKTDLKAVSWLLQGWQLSSIFQISSGLPFTPLIAGDALGLNSTNTWDYPDRLDIPGCANPVNPGNPNNYIKQSCFAAPFPATRLGDAGRNVAIGPGLIDLDSSLFKNNYIPRISETFNIQLRLEVFNVVNHPNFGPPTGTTSTQLFTQALASIPTAGTLTLTSTSSRQIQLAVKVIW
jgi:Carboxypeptidase regulatory-like domain/TonB dependent receptor/TonB-dependent Receptor Plug Domain